MVLRNRHVLAKITSRLTVIQLTEMSWQCVTLVVLKVLIYIVNCRVPTPASTYFIGVSTNAVTCYKNKIRT